MSCRYPFGFIDSDSMERKSESGFGMSWGGERGCSIRYGKAVRVGFWNTCPV